MSPAKTESGSPSKRKRGASPSKQNGTSKSHKKHRSQDPDGEQPFKFEEVKTMIDKVLESERSRSTHVASSASLKQLDFEDIAVPGHSVEGCKTLIEKLVNMTRRVRTLEEVLTEVRENLNKQVYTKAIMRASISGPLPKKPPTAYLLFHKERYDDYRGKISKASEIAKLVSDEWRSLSERQRQRYIDEHNKLTRTYEKECKKFGLVPSQKPKRARSAKALYALNKLDELDIEGELDKDEMKRLKKQYQEEFDDLDQETKAYWSEQYFCEQERYKRERSEYIAANPHLDHHERVKEPKNTVKPPEPPKSAFKIFLEKKLPEGIDGPEKDETKKSLKEKFSKLTDKKLIKLIKKAMKDKQRYDAEVEEYKQTHPDFVVPKFKPSISKDQWKLYESIIEKKPNAPAPTAYLYFCGGLLAGEVNSDSSSVPTQRMLTASKTWSAMSSAEKLEVEKEHLAALQDYVVKMEDWMSKQDAERQEQIRRDEPRNVPHYWKKRIAKLERAINKKEKEDQDA